MRRNPFRIGEVLRLSFWVWVKNIVPFTALALVLHAPLILWAAYLVSLGEQVDPARWDEHQNYNALGLLLVNALLSAAVTYGVVMELDRRPASIGRVIAMGLRRFVPAFAVSLLGAIAVFGATMLLIIPGIIVTCMLYVAVPASVIERPGILGALRRSRQLTAGSRVKVFVLALLAVVMNAAVTLGLFHAVWGASYAHFVGVADLARSVLVGPLVATVVATTYALLRRQRDGVSSDELARVFE